MEFATRGTYREQVTKLCNVVSEYLASPDAQLCDEEIRLDAIEEELVVQLNRLKSAHDSLNKANNDVRAAGAVKAEDSGKEAEMIAEYEDKALAVIFRIEQRLGKVRQRQDRLIGGMSSTSAKLNVTPSTSVHNAVKLHKLRLRKFSGDAKDWLPFWEQFSSVIHENVTLSAIDKFNYLEEVLDGKAADTIAGLTPTPACYESAVSLLKEEYGNTDKLIDQMMQRLLATTPVSSKTDASSLRRLYNHITTCTRSLSALGVSSSNYYIMLKGALIRCLPHDLRVDFHRHCSAVPIESTVANEESNNDNDGGSVFSVARSSSIIDIADGQVRALLKFLKNEVESLEKASEANRNQPSNSSNRLQSTQSVKTATGLLTSATTTESTCFLCKSSSHATKECNSTQSLAERKVALKGDGRCFRCCKRGHHARICRNQSIVCRTCEGRHATCLCDPQYAVKRELPAATADGNNTRNQSGSSSSPSTVLATLPQKSLNLYTTNTTQQVFLQTACVFVSGEVSRQKLLIRIILDGGSQVSFIRKTVARKLKLPIVGSQNLSIINFGCNQQVDAQQCNRVGVTLRSQYSENIVTLEALEVPEICVDVLAVPDDKNTFFKPFMLADARITGEPEEGINMLIGADSYWQLVTGEHKRITDKLTAINTVFGWTLQGPSSSVFSSSVNSQIATASLNVCVCEEAKQFWQLESIGITSPSVNSDLNIMSTSQVKRVGNRYVASLPWKNQDELHNHRNGAELRLKTLLRKLIATGTLHLYDTAMREMLNNGFAEEVHDTGLKGRTYYMPHRPVYREDKTTTKLRIVFDASAHVSNHLSLNESLNVGCNVLPDILSVLLNFRGGSIALVADIEKAFLQILLNYKDRDSHRFLWFHDKLNIENNSLPPVKTFGMTRVTFGITSSPFLLGATIVKLIQDQAERFPKTCEVLQGSFYMDDLIISTDSEETAINIHRDANAIMQEASMNLRKWNSNNPRIRQLFNEQGIPSDSQKVLGLRWFVITDELSVDLDSIKTLLKTNPAGTKRSLLQVIAKVYDPFGILGPCTVRWKILFQGLWKMKIQWDEPLPNEVQRDWNECAQDIEQMEEISIPREVGCCARHVKRQIHIFADASSRAYGAVAYWRTEKENGEISIRFLYSKNRVAPINSNGTNELTLPKLELTAALIAARMLHYLKENFKLMLLQPEVWLWTDSQIALAWITGDKRWKPYIYNRVQEIRTLTDATQWKHCPGSENPADLLTRGISGIALSKSTCWMSGPAWLRCDEEHWPRPRITEHYIVAASLIAQTIDVDSSVYILDNTKPLLHYEDFSTWRKLTRVTAYTFRFIELTKKKILGSKFLSTSEIQSAEQHWIQFIQRHHFLDELAALKDKKGISLSSKLMNLSPFLDENGCIRVGGRLQFLVDDTERAHPIILDKYSHLTALIVKDIHERTFHGGSAVVMARVRERFWIPRGRQLVRTVIANCATCRVLRSKPMSQPFAPLPRDRLLQNRAFEITGLDFAGPLYIKTSTEPKKMYIMLFTCAAIRAVHLELTPDMSTESCILGLRRFVARRGVPRIIYSDNAKSFKRSSIELRKLQKLNTDEKIHGFFNNTGITWKFIVERAPWWGGFWERLVGSVKKALRAVIGRASLNEDEIYTLLVEVEGVINSRPLTYIGEDPLDLLPLTPAHFLQNAVTTTLHSPDINMGHRKLTDCNLRKLWKERLRALGAFRKRWHNEYLQQLRSAHYQQKQKFSSTVSIGDVVLLYDAVAPKSFWKLAVIEEVFPGRDGKIRSCSIRLNNGSRYKRPVQLLYPLELRQLS